MYDELKCAHCGGEHTHHNIVEVFNRDKEDSEDGTHAAVEGHSVSTDRIMYGNPSGRRDGVCIRYTCEYCDGISVLVIRQRKGTTYVESKKYERPRLPVTEQEIAAMTFSEEQEELEKTYVEKYGMTYKERYRW